jgi:hypothetical protein
VIIIDTPADLRRVAANPALPQELRDTLADLFWATCRQLGADPATCRLAAVAPIAIIEAGDSLESLPGAGRKVAEWADMIEIVGRVFIDVGILEGNERCWRLFGEVGALDPVVEAYLAAEASGA